MNRGFRAPESKMPGPLHHRLGMKLGSIMKEKEEELALFLELRKREKEITNMLLRNVDEFDPSLVSKSGDSPIFKVATVTASRRVGSDDFLNSDAEKNDYDCSTGNWVKGLRQRELMTREGKVFTFNASGKRRRRPGTEKGDQE